MFTDDIAALLEANDCGTVAASIFIDRFTDDQVTQLAVFEMPGMASLMTQQDPLGVQRVTCQVSAKAKTRDDARTLAEKAHRVLSTTFNTKLPLDQTFYLQMIPETPPFLMGRDQNELVMYGFNVQVQKYPSPAPVP